MIGGAEPVMRLTLSSLPPARCGFRSAPSPASTAAGNLRQIVRVVCTSAAHWN